MTHCTHHKNKCNICFQTRTHCPHTCSTKVRLNLSYSQTHVDLLHVHTPALTPSRSQTKLYFSDDQTTKHNSVHADIVGMVIYIMASSDPHLPIPVRVAIAAPTHPLLSTSPIAESIHLQVRNRLASPQKRILLPLA